jgi:hypothetical protein
MKYQTFASLMQLATTRVRLQAYDLLTASFETTVPVPEEALQYLFVTDTLRYLHDDNDPHERGEMLSITRRFLRRLGTGNFNPKHPNGSSDYDKLFIDRLQSFLTQELSPGVSYTRHALALNVLHCLIDIPALRKVVRVNDLFQPTLGLIFDPFDDVRSTAALVATNLLASLQNDTNATNVSLQLLKDTETVSYSTCRQDHADATGRLWALFMLDNTLLFTKSELNKPEEIMRTISGRITGYLEKCTTLTPGVDFPLHALLYALYHGLAYVPEHLWSLSPPLLKICQKLWILVQPHLCVDSPETTTDEMEDRGPKDLLAYAWRALRDSRSV